MSINETEVITEAIFRLTEIQGAKGFNLESIHYYKNELSEIQYVRVRMINTSQEKWIRPLSKDENGNWTQLKEPKFLNGKPLYNLDLIHTYKDQTIYIVEGEKCADYLVSLGILATTSGGSSSVNDVDWRILSGRNIVIWPDNDKPGLQYSQNVIKKLVTLNCKIQVIDISNLNLPEKGDCVDWLKKFAEINGIDAKKEDVEKLALISAEVNLNSSKPEKLPTLPDVLPFNYEYLPSILRTYVEDISERMQCPPDFAAVAVFVMLASILGRKISVRPLQKDNWTVIPNLWGAVVGNSGVMKSPTLSASTYPLKKLMSKAYDEFNKSKLEQEKQVQIAQIQKAIALSKAKNAMKKDINADVSNLLISEDGFQTPILKRYITNNSTYEALGELLIENPDGILVEADELIGLIKQLDSHGQEPARAFYLTAADGDKSYTFDRVSRGKALHIEGVCISILGGIQPGVLAEYVRLANNGGAGADGLLQRFGLIVYPDIPNTWNEVDRTPNAEALQSIINLTERLDKLNTDSIAAESDSTSKIPFLRFNEKAQLIFSDWRNKLEQKLRSGEDHPSVVSHLSKYRKLIPTIALLNQLCTETNGSINEDSLSRAIAFSNYLESHARRIYSYATSQEIDAAKSLLKKLKNSKLENIFKARDVSQKGWTGLETPEKAQMAINLLVEYKHLTEEPLNTGGRPTILYHWVKE